MPASSFKFVSPGVFINEIDNSFIPKSADTIGPVIVGRARRGLAMQPVKISSYSEFVEVFGETVPGGRGGDVWRDGNYQSPMYATYAAKAFLNANVGPVTFIRALGAQHTDATAAGYCGWATNKNGSPVHASNGGAYGLWVFKSASSFAHGRAGKGAILGTGSLAAIWYVDASSSIQLSGNLFGGPTTLTSASLGAVIGTDSNKLFTVLITGSDGSSEKIKFNLDDTSEHFIRKQFNTNPQIGNEFASDFFPAASEKKYWLRGTFGQFVRTGYQDAITGSSTNLSTDNLLGVMQAINLTGTVGTGPHNMKSPSGGQYQEAKAGWFVGQDLGAPAACEYNGLQRLFRLVGRGHAEWLNRNAKVSIEQIRGSNSLVSAYGTFSIVIRNIRDSDNAVVVLERFDNLTLDPASPDFLARRLGDKYYAWSDTDRRLKEYGEYDNQSKFVYVELDADVENGSTPPALLPWGYYGPPRFKGVTAYSGTVSGGPTANTYMSPGSSVSRFGYAGGTFETGLVGLRPASGSLVTGSFHFPRVRLRNSASDAQLSDPRDVYFGMDTSRIAGSTVYDPSVPDFHRQWLPTVTDPVTSAVTGLDSYAYIFTMDDVSYDSTTKTYHYVSGSRVAETSYTATGANSWKTLVDAGYNQFTAPMWGGYDAVDITKPDPFYNKGMTAGTSTELNSYIYNTWKRALDTVADPETLDMNMLSAPGLTFDSLTTHLVRLCESRADALGLIDLASVYIPPAEEYKSSRADRRGTTPTAAASALRDRQIESSYGATFYPWVQTVDASTQQRLWVPPTVAALGVLGSSQAKTDVWFAPAGFNRGGLSSGAAGLPVINVTEKLTSRERDTLYDSNINPIASFPSSGIVLFGQKTLQTRQSALDRINVRRLVIFLKKQISILSTRVLFEQNVESTWKRFKALVDPFLAGVLTGFGISDYRLILDESTTTADLIDQNVMYAKIMIKPTRAIEYIAIDFVIASTGASFDD